MDLMATPVSVHKVRAGGEATTASLLLLPVPHASIIKSGDGQDANRAQLCHMIKR